MQVGRKKGERGSRSQERSESKRETSVVELRPIRLSPRKKERKIAYLYLKTRDPTIFDVMGLNNYALRLVLIYKAPQLSKIRSKSHLVATIDKMKEMLSNSVFARRGSFVCKVCNEDFKSKAEALEHVISVHDILSF